MGIEAHEALFYYSVNRILIIKLLEFSLNDLQCTLLLLNTLQLQVL